MVKGAVLSPLTPEIVQRPREKQEKKSIPNSLAWHIEEFDTNPKAHGLDGNWYKFHGIGFLMNAHMNLLPEGAEKNPAQLATWADQTKRDILGLCLEHL